MSFQWKNLDRMQVLALKGLGGEQGVFIRPAMTLAVGGDGNASILLSHLIYWSQSDFAAEHDGWFYLTTQKASQTTGLTRQVQERVRDKLIGMGILEKDLRGMPAKNYYRVNLQKVAEVVSAEYYEPANKYAGKHTSSKSDSIQQDVSNDGDIVNTLVKTPSNSIYGSSRRSARNDPVNVLGAEFDRYVDGIRRTYPLNYQGLPVTEVQARKALSKYGTLKADHTPEEAEAAKTRVSTFVKAVKNIRAAVDAGDLETKFVPGFPKFAGLGISYGQEPPCMAWASRVIIPKKKELVV